jgi:formate dehydrogenase subunit gamma
MTVPSTAPAGERLDVRVREIVANHRDDRGALLPILHSVLSEFGCVSPEVIPLIAAELNLSRAEVHGVASFYRDFRAEPAGRTTVRICRAEACQAVGGRELAASAVDQIGVGFGQTTPDGGVTLDEVFCLGNCALGPSIAINGVTHGRVDAARLDALVSEAKTR